MKFKNIFFDLGGVLFNLNTRRSLRIFHTYGMPVPDAILKDDQPFNGSPDGHPVFQLIHKLDVGDIMGKEFVQIVKSQCREGITDQQILEAYNGMLDIPVSRLQLLMRLREKYKLFLVSNIGDLHWEASCNMASKLGYPMEKCFHHCFCSYQMRVAKPDPAFFQMAISQSGVIPSETLYIDDSAQNIAVGKEAGLIAYKIEPNTLEEHIPILFHDEC